MSVARPLPVREIEPRHGLTGLGLSELRHTGTLLWLFILRELKLRYVQTALGPLWVIVNPLVPALLFTFVFTKVTTIDTGGLPVPRRDHRRHGALEHGEPDASAAEGERSSASATSSRRSTSRACSSRSRSPSPSSSTTSWRSRIAGAGDPAVRSAGDLARRGPAAARGVDARARPGRHAARRGRERPAPRRPQRAADRDHGVALREPDRLHARFGVRLGRARSSASIR